MAVAEERRISRAADRLFISQPALSRQMQQLEREVGAQLLLRGPRGVELTPAGQVVLDKARVALEAAEEALGVGRAAEPHGRLVLGLPFAGGRDRWFALTQAFCDRYGAVEVEMRAALSEQLQRQVLEHELDGALAVAPRHLEGLTYTRVLDEPLAVWMHPRHPLADRRELTLGDLAGVSVTLLGGAVGRASGFNAAIRALFAEAGVVARIDETSQVYPPSAAMAADYLSVSVRLDYPAATVRVPLVPARTLPFVFVQRAGTNVAAVRAFARFAREHLAELSCSPRMPPA